MDKIEFEENFIFNKKEANIPEIQKLLEFSSIFGKEQFFIYENFYKKGDENKLIEDYRKQEKGINYFNKNKNDFNQLKILIAKIKNIKNIYKNNYYKLSETDLFDLKQFILTCEEIFNIFKKSDISLNYKNPEIKSIIKIFDKKNPDIPAFYIDKNYNKTLSLHYRELEELEKKLDKEKQKIEKYISENFINISFDNPKILLKESKNFDNLNKFIKYFIIEEDNPIFIKIKIKKNDIINSIEKEISIIKEKIIDEKNKILENISKKIFEKKDVILHAFQYIGTIDSFLAKISFAIKYKCIIPEINYDNFILKNAKNIYLEKILNEQNLTYTPLSISLKKGLAIITGSNMGGKTWVLKTIAQIAYIVHAGLMVPAEYVSIPLFNGIFINGSTNSQSEGLSSFGYEIYSLNKIWEHINNFFLILLDEPAKGTNPLEGKVIVKSLAKTLSESNSFSIITTHYDNIVNNINCKKFTIKGINEEKFLQYIEFLKYKSRINENKINKSKISKNEINKRKEDTLDSDLADQNFQYSNNNIFDIRTIHKFIDHSLTEITTNLEVPKNALKLMKLFNFDNNFIKLCERNLKNKE